MPFIRIISGAEKWYDENPNIESIQSRLRDSQGGPPSFYWVDDPTDEVGFVAAHILTNTEATKPSMESVHVLRAHREDLVATGVYDDWEKLGVTGVVSVDFAHCELKDIAKDKRKHFAEFIKQINKCLIIGEDRIRQIKRSQLKYALEKIVESPRERVTPFAVRQASRALEKPIPDSCAATGCKSECDGVLFRIPHSNVAREAYVRRLNNPQMGLSDLNLWIESERYLRDRYLKNYKDKNSGI